MSDFERFAALFDGFKQRFGRYDVAGGDKVEGEKVQGKARTVDRPLTIDLYEKHLEGSVGIGVIPLRDDDTVRFAAIDIDVYKQEDRAKRNLTHEDIAQSLAATPLIVTRSKSNGIHVWLFASKPVRAENAVAYLHSIAAMLGVSGTEVFPKQTARANDQDIGNWINLPYFGRTTRRAVVPVTENGVTSFHDLTLDTFLDAAETASLTVDDDWLITNTFEHGSQRDGSSDAPSDMFLDGPPCLQSLIVGWASKREAIQKKFDTGQITQDQYDKQMKFTYPQLTKGARDHTFLQVGLYLRRRLNGDVEPDAALSQEDRDKLEEQLHDAHRKWGVAVHGTDFIGNEAKLGIANDIQRLAKQAAKGKWGYKCTQEPLKGFCNRRLCTKRKFGIGVSRADVPEISDFTIMTSEDRQYFLTFGETRIHIADVETLMSQTRFRNAITNQADVVWPMMPNPKYEEMIAALIKDAKEQNRLISPPPDSDRKSIVLDLLSDFITSKRIERGQNDASFHNGRVIWDEDEKHAWFKLKEFMSYVRNAGHVWTHTVVSKMLVEDFGVTPRGNTFIGGKQARPYVVEVARLEHLLTVGVADGED